MLTKKSALRYLNLFLLAVTLAVGVVAWLLPKLSTSEKMVGTAGLLTGILYGLPFLKKQTREVIEQSDLPDDEPAIAPIRKDAGIATPFLLFITMVVALVATLAGSAKAEEGRYSIGASMSSALVAVNVRTGDLYAGGQALALGPCFSVAHKATGLGGNGCFNYQRMPDQANSYSLGLYVSWKMASFGLGLVKPVGEAFIPLIMGGLQADVWKTQ